MAKRSDTRKKVRRAQKTRKAVKGGLFGWFENANSNENATPIVKVRPGLRTTSNGRPVKSILKIKKNPTANNSINVSKYNIRGLNNYINLSKKYKRDPSKAVVEVIVPSKKQQKKNRSINTTARNEHGNPITHTVNGILIERNAKGRSMTPNQIYQAKPLMVRVIDAVKRGDDVRLSSILERENVHPNAMETALQVAVRTGNMNIIRKLLWSGADPMLPAKKGERAIDIALAQEPPNYEVIKTLYKAIAKPANKNSVKNKYMEIMSKKEVQEE